MQPLRSLVCALLLGSMLACVGSVSNLDGDGGLLATGGSGAGTTGGGAGGGATGGSAGTGGSTGHSNLDAPLTPGDPGSADVVFEVHSNAGRHAISPLIYGTNQPADPARNRYGVLRLGGNRLTAYNWENNASNAGSDYQFQNDNYLSNSSVPGAAVTAKLTAAKAIGAAALVTIPIVDYVAADTNGGGDVRNSGSNYLQTRFRQNRAVNPSGAVTAPVTSDAYVNQDDFVTWLKANDQSVKVLFSLDNEPDLWADTHAEVHPAKLTYNELVTRNITFAKMAKSIWPEAPVTGFVSYGFGGFVNLQSAPDASGNGDFINYYLDHLKAAETSEGHRLVDYLDLHWYPEAKGGGTRITGTGTTTELVTARVQAPRSLWDTTYSESSWIQQYYSGPIRLLPRLRDAIAQHYPGTQLAFTEWNYGGGGHISGAIATADVLGIFGRDEVGLATYWKLNGAEPFADAAFMAFRNFDGAGASFGDLSLQATSSAAAMASVYASVDSLNSDRTVIVAINKEAVAHTAAIKLSHPTAYASLRVYTLTSSQAQVVAGTAVQATALNAFRYSMPPLSVSVLVPQP